MAGSCVPEVNWGYFLHYFELYSVNGDAAGPAMLAFVLKANSTKYGFGGPITQGSTEK